MKVHFIKSKLLLNLVIVVVGAIPFILYKDIFKNETLVFVIYCILGAFLLWTLFSYSRMLKPALIIEDGYIVDNTNIFKQNRLIMKETLKSVELQDKISRSGKLQYIKIQTTENAFLIYGENLTISVEEIFAVLEKWKS